MTRQVLNCFSLLAMLLVASAAVAAQPTGVQLTNLAEEGESLFRQHCDSCHTIGQGDKVTGPDLAGVTDRRERQWLVDFITNPEKLIKAGDPTANESLRKFNNFQMPGHEYQPAQMNALLTYLAHPEEVAHHVAEAIPRIVGDPVRGEALFVGMTAFASGAAPCLACHGIAQTGLGRATGASYGPDLSSTFDDFGEEELLDLLVDMPFTSMEAIYATRPISGQERADLTAFMGSVSGQLAPIGATLTLHVGLATLVIFAIIGALGWRRLQGARQPLIEQARNGKGETV